MIVSQSGEGFLWDEEGNDKERSGVIGVILAVDVHLSVLSDELRGWRLN